MRRLDIEAFEIVWLIGGFIAIGFMIGVAI